VKVGGWWVCRRFPGGSSSAKRAFPWWNLHQFFPSLSPKHRSFSGQTIQVFDIGEIPKFLPLILISSGGARQFSLGRKAPFLLDLSRGKLMTYFQAASKMAKAIKIKICGYTSYWLLWSAASSSPGSSSAWSLRDAMATTVNDTCSGNLHDKYWNGVSNHDIWLCAAYLASYIWNNYSVTEGTLFLPHPANLLTWYLIVLLHLRGPLYSHDHRYQTIVALLLSPSVSQQIHPNRNTRGWRLCNCFQSIHCHSDAYSVCILSYLMPTRSDTHGPTINWIYHHLK